jgi:ADP-heptose:LPS heptosyltransferase
MPFEYIVKLIEQHPEHEWINLQADATDEETAKLVAAGVQVYPGSTTNFADTAALMHHLDLIISVDTVTAHLAGALSKPVWIMLNNYAVDWRWLIDKNTTWWYPSAVLFRQDSMDNWDSVLTKLNQHLRLYKI